MTQKLLDTYRAMLRTAGFVADEQGYVSYPNGNERTPAMVKIEGSPKRLVLPTREHLTNPDWADRVAFHPLSENILRGESEVLAYLRHAMNLRINLVFGLLAYQLLEVATSTAQHSKLNPDQSYFLSKVKDADEKTLHVFEKLLEAMPNNQTQRSLVSIYLKRSGQVGGRRYARVGVVRFPLYEELKTSTQECYGVKMRVKDRDALVALIEYMIPNVDQSEAYYRGSDSSVAPFTDALMKAVMSVAGPLNDLVELFRNQLDEPDSLLFESSWVETFENLGVLQNDIRSIPMQVGNEGGHSNPAPPQAAAAVAPSVQGVAAAPAQAPAAARPFQQPTAAPSPTGHNPQAPVYGQAAPAYQPPPAAAPTGPVNTGRGLDFNSVIASNPALQMATAGYGMPAMGMGMAGPRTPRWAMGGMGMAPMQAPMYGQQQPMMGGMGGGFAQQQPNFGFNPGFNQGGGFGGGGGFGRI